MKRNTGHLSAHEWITQHNVALEGRLRDYDVYLFYMWLFLAGAVITFFSIEKAFDFPGLSFAGFFFGSAILIGVIFICRRYPLLVGPKLASFPRPSKQLKVPPELDFMNTVDNTERGQQNIILNAISTRDVEVYKYTEVEVTDAASVNLDED